MVIPAGYRLITEWRDPQIGDIWVSESGSNYLRITDVIENTFRYLSTHNFEELHSNAHWVRSADIRELRSAGYMRLEKDNKKIKRNLPGWF